MSVDSNKNDGLPKTHSGWVDRMEKLSVAQSNYWLKNQVEGVIPEGSKSAYNIYDKVISFAASEALKAKNNEKPFLGREN